MKNTFYTYNQIQLLDIIRCFRFLPIKALFKIADTKGLYSRRASITDVVKKFEKLDMVKSFYYAHNTKVVYLTKKGADLLVDKFGIDSSQISVPRSNRKVHFARLEHTVKIADLYCELIEEVENIPDAEILQWTADQLFHGRYSYRSDASSRMVKRMLFPDSFFTIRNGTSEKSYFLEYDTGSMDRTQLANKFRQYFEYFVYGKWQKKYSRFPTTLFLTDRTKERLENLFVEDESSLDDALDERELFRKSDNVLWKGVGLSENIESIPSYEIEDFLSQKFIFNFTKSEWAKELLE